MNHGCPFFAPSVRFEFWAPMRPRTRCQPNSARSLVHLNFPPLASSLPPFLVLRFRPSRNHISRPRALPHSSHLGTIIPLYSSGAWHYLGVLASPFIRFEIRRSFRFPAAAHTVYACALPAATFDPVNEVLTHPFCLKYFRLDVYYHATSNTHGTQIDRSCDFQGPPATAGVSRALILPPFPQLKEAAELQPIHHHVRE